MNRLGRILTISTLLLISAACHKVSKAGKQDTDSTPSTSGDNAGDSATSPADYGSTDSTGPVDSSWVDSGGTDGTSINSTDSTAVTDLTPAECLAAGKRPYRSVDLLLVVDNSGSMSQEQEMLSTAIFTLYNELSNPVAGGDVIDSIRIAVTTTDMGVSVGGEPYVDKDDQFDNPQVRCSGLGDNGAFQADYQNWVPRVLEGHIACTDSATHCPAGWTCEALDGQSEKICMSQGYESSEIECPDSPSHQIVQYVDNQIQSSIAATAACLVQATGTDGCNYEQQLAASVAGLSNTPEFVRADSLTVVIVVSDEEDCSLASNEWHDLSELTKVTANLACGRYPEYLVAVEEIKESLETAKRVAGGKKADIVFAGIIGVPIATTCQGTGENLSDCLNIKPGVNGTGTLADPEEVTRTTITGVIQYYFEYACERFQGDDAYTAAYPGARYVRLAQQFADRGYIYSICNPDWSPAMEDIADMIIDKTKVTCVE
ncbi:MAG: hypothetical protein JXX14_11830 [Deltaproteobacteria bacterium]|nr:hypothetical protein [Deltaproteobacteria bacterium]